MGAQLRRRAVGHAVSLARPLQRADGSRRPTALVPRQRHRQRVQPVRGVPHRGDPGQRPPPQRLRRPSGGLVAVRAQGQVQLARAQLLHQVHGGQAQHVHLDGGVALGEPLEDLRQVAQRVVVRRAQADGAVDGGRAEAGPDLVVQRQQVARPVQQELAMRRQVDGAALAAGQQALAEQALQPLHLHGDRRLRAADTLGGAGEAAVLGDAGKGPQQVRVEAGVGHGHQSA